MAIDESSTQLAEQPELFYLPAEKNEALRVASIGLVVGLAVPLLGILISGLVGKFFCASESAVCLSRDIIASHVSAIFVGMAAFSVLMRFDVYRALLLVVSSVVATWGFANYAQPILENSYVEYFLLSALICILTFMIFYWLLRIKNFVLSLVLVILLTISACVAMAV